MIMATWETLTHVDGVQLAFYEPFASITVGQIDQTWIEQDSHLGKEFTDGKLRASQIKGREFLLNENYLSKAKL
jgi:hypothetical protein